ncbi:unnamed protein product [Brachionus calyciflorus]|uniref:DZF domain-containing protein n=1 Tax=Brachionus calyciflorus TaxID=104777 RepID=A0A814EZY7_9BILA|nr:unnamed protein product [Brachionus calyciflorus]
MSFYGYPNTGAFNAYAAAYNQYQAAYNAAAFGAIQPTQQTNTSSTQSSGGVSISQPAQKYDYQQQQAAAANKAAMNATAAFYAGAYGFNKAQASKWPPMTTTPGQLTPGQKKSKFKPRPGTQVQMFYCETCKISCAGPQTYKEHLEGQKHKKKEEMAKQNEKKIEQAASGSEPVQKNFNRFNNKTQNIIQCQLCDVACTGRDAYSAHIRGSKHQKTLKLHQKLGKPIPQELVSQPQPVPPPSQPGQVVIAAPPKVNFVPGANLNSIAKNEPNVAQLNTTADAAPVLPYPSEQTNEANDDHDSSNNEPIGREYIETRMEGKILTFYCKLCDCKFNDPNAKDMHTKGRRHRLAYKKKVDPSLVVDMKGPLAKTKNGRLPKTRGKDSESQDITTTSSNSQNILSLMSQNIKPVSNMNRFSTYNQQQQQQQPYQHKGESFDDRHVIFKHNSIYPSKDEINAIQEIVTSTEKALKLVSDQMAKEDSVTQIKLECKDSTKPDQPQSFMNDQFGSEGPKEEARCLKGVMRVGLLAKGLLLKGDTDVKLIVICANKPTKTLLERVHKLLVQKIEVVSPEIKYSIILDKDAETILIIRLTINEVQPLITCRVLLTSPVIREQLNLVSTNENETDLLDKQKCLDSLADLRHAKWFQARASQVPNCVVTIRILRDLCRRNPTWSPLTQWALELLIERSLTSANQNLSPGEAFRRVLECVSAGVLLPNETGILDPCEKEPVDVTDNLTGQQREEITGSAHMALRLMAFKQIHKILGIELISQPLNRRLPVKRQHDNETTEAVEEKKEKKEENESVAKA